MEEYTIITVQSRDKFVEIRIPQKFIDDERLDVLKKGCERAWQEFVIEAGWKIAKD